MIATEAQTSRQSIAALGFLADFAVSCRPLDGVVANKAPLQIEALIETAGAEDLAGHESSLAHPPDG
jgi:hypothetical protein